jgi:regulator of sigma E protease
MLAWLAPLLVLGLVVFVHELGHFLAAKMCGVYAPRFSLGWGSPLWRWRPKGSETEYVISWLPIGGYVRMASRDDETMSKIEGGGEKLPETGEAENPKDPNWDPEAMVPHGPKPIPESRWFESKPAYQRVFILLAGVTMNAILAVAVATSIYAVYGVDVAPPSVAAVVNTVVPGRPAERAGFKPGDSVVAVNDVVIREWPDFLREVTARPGQLLSVGVVRSGAPMTLSVTPDSMQEPDSATGAMRTVGRIGMGPLVRAIRKPVSLGQAASLGTSWTWARGAEVVGILKGLFSGSVSVKQLGGPIAIARGSVAAAKSGVEELFGLIAFLSINLAILNLLPVPILDGGQILVTLAEGARGKPFTLRTRENLMKAGVAFILVLFSIVMFNDISSLVKSWFS